MATVIHRTTNEIRFSVNTPDYDPATWIIAPILPAGVPSKYLTITGDTVSEMLQGEKDAVDAAIAQAAIDSDRIAAKTDFDQHTLKAFSLVVLDEINALRTVATLPPRTAQQLRAAIEAKIDEV